MNIVLVGNNSLYNAEYFYKKAFLELGNNVSFLNSYRRIKRKLLYRVKYTRTNLFERGLDKLWSFSQNYPFSINSVD